MPSYSGKRKNKPTLPCVRTSEPILSGEDSGKLKDCDDVSLRELAKKNNLVLLAQKQVNQINRYIIDNSSFVPYKIKCTAKWQRESSKALHALGIGV